MSRTPYQGSPDLATRAVAQQIKSSRILLADAHAVGKMEAQRLRAEGVPLRTIADWLGVSRATVDTWTRIIAQERPAQLQHDMSEKEDV